MKAPGSKFPAIDLETSFFGFLIKKMKPMPAKKIIKALHFVLISLLKSQPTRKINKLIKKLPPTLQLVFVGCWQADFPKFPPVNHLDELVENIYRYRDSSKNSIFRSRVEVLTTVLIVIKALKLLFEKIGVTIIPHTIESEYQQAAIADAA